MRRQAPRSLASCTTIPTRLFAVVVLSSATAAAGGSDPAPSDIATARILGTEGLRLAETGDCAAAIEKLERAEALFHAPTTLGRLGECQVALGRIVAGTESLQRVVREQLAPNVSPAFLAAKERAQHVLADALPRLAMLRITVDVAKGRALTVRVDGRPLPDATLGVERPTDPGSHTIESEALGCDRIRRTVTLDEGGEASVSIAMVCGVLPASVPSSSRGRAAVRPRDDTVAYVAMGVGAAGIAAGSVFGLMALRNKGALADVCDGERSCPATSQSELDDLDRNAMLSNIGFGVGLAGVALGTTLLVWPMENSSVADTGTSTVSGDRLRASAWVGPGSAGLAGSF